MAQVASGELVVSYSAVCMQCLSCSDLLLQVEEAENHSSFRSAWWLMALSAVSKSDLCRQGFLLPDCPGTPTWGVGLMDVENLIAAFQGNLKNCLLFGPGMAASRTILGNFWNWQPKSWLFPVPPTAQLPPWPPWNLSLTLSAGLALPRKGTNLRRTHLGYVCSTASSSCCAKLSSPIPWNQNSASRMEKRQNIKCQESSQDRAKEDLV